MKKGLGSYQKSAMSYVQIEIILALRNGKWHRYKQLKTELKDRVCPATLSKHLKRLVEHLIVEKKTELTSYPPPVFYRLTEKKSILVQFGKRYGLALGKLIKTLEQVKSQDEYLELVSDFFGDGLNTMSKLANQMRSDDVGMMINLFMDWLKSMVVEPFLAKQITKKGNES